VLKILANRWFFNTNLNESLQKEATDLTDQLVFILKQIVVLKATQEKCCQIMVIRSHSGNRQQGLRHAGRHFQYLFRFTPEY
jgi:hypothetical protein